LGLAGAISSSFVRGVREDGGAEDQGEARTNLSTHGGFEGPNARLIRGLVSG
jgi:hypothetical protein